MPDQTAREFVALATDGFDANGKQWIEVLPTAEKAKNGPYFFTIDAAALEAAAAYIQANPDRIPVDYNHATASGGDSVAAGWFTGQAEVREGDNGPTLWAEVEWTKQGQEEVVSKRYRFISAEWKPVKVDKKSGLMTGIKELVAATLTNRPFFRELAPVASVIWPANAGFESLRQKVSQAINPASASDSRYWIMDVTTDRALIQEYRASKTWVAAFVIGADGQVTVDPTNAWTEAQQEWVSAASEALQHHLSRKPFRERIDMDTTVLAKSLGLADDADESAIADAIKAKTDEVEKLTAQIEELTAKADVSDDLKRMATEGAKAAQELALMKVDSLIATAVSSGKIPPVAKDAYATMAASDYDGTKALIDAMPEKSFKETGDGGDGGEGDGTDEEKEIAAATKRFGDEPVDGADLHVKAMRHLKEQGKHEPSQEEYAAALEIVSTS